MHLVVNTQTEKRLAMLTQDLPHAVLLSGSQGVGLATIAKSIAKSNLASLIEPLDRKRKLDRETGTISVEVIRELYDQTRSKSLVRQVFVVDDADRMSAGASAAFLKLLEEPTANTHFILTSHRPQMLLSTILSRVQAVYIEPVSSAQTRDHIKKLAVTDPKTTMQLEYLGLGLPAELTRLASDIGYFNERAELMTDTRTFLSGTSYQKMLIAQKYNSDRSKAIGLLESALMVAKRTLDAKPQPGLIQQMERLLFAKERIAANGNVRLQLLAFVVQ